jgi:hypothetical protein
LAAKTKATNKEEIIELKSLLRSRMKSVKSVDCFETSGDSKTFGSDEMTEKTCETNRFGLEEKGEPMDKETERRRAKEEEEEEEDGERLSV